MDSWTHEHGTSFSNRNLKTCWIAFVRGIMTTFLRKGTKMFEKGNFVIGHKRDHEDQKKEKRKKNWTEKFIQELKKKSMR